MVCVEVLAFDFVVIDLIVDLVVCVVGKFYKNVWYLLGLALCIMVAFWTIKYDSGPCPYLIFIDFLVP